MPVESYDIPSPKARKLYLAALVNQKSMNDLTKAIISINEHDRLLEKLYPAYNVEYTAPPIEIYIDSYGGAVYQCFGLLGVIECYSGPYDCSWCRHVLWFYDFNLWA